MKWINPREQLPEEDQLIWILRIENRKGERLGDPSAQICIARAKTSWHVMEAAEINHKGMEAYSKYFYEIYHLAKCMCKIKYNKLCEHDNWGNTHSDEDMIDAWAPYQGNEIPDWSFITYQESKELLLKNAEYLRRHKIRNSTPGYTFIGEDECRPDHNQVCAVANKYGIYLCRYDEKATDPWMSPNGYPVEGWFPVPDYYAVEDSK